MALEPITTTLEQIVNLTPTVKHFRLRFPKGQRVDFQPGQFCSIHIPEICGLDPKSGKPLRRAYSIASSPHEEETLDLCIKRVEGGPGSNWLWQQKEGDKVLTSLPYGKFLIKEPVNYSPIFVATGTGIAPFRSMIFSLYHHKKILERREAWLIFGVRHEDEILYEKEWRDLEKRENGFRFIPTVSRPKDWKGEVGYVQEKLKKFLTDPRERQVYICGLGNMVKEVQKTALEIGFKEMQINFEKWN